LSSACAPGDAWRRGLICCARVERRARGSATSAARWSVREWVLEPDQSAWEDDRTLQQPWSVRADFRVREADPTPAPPPTQDRAECSDEQTTRERATRFIDTRQLRSNRRKGGRAAPPTYCHRRLRRASSESCGEKPRQHRPDVRGALALGCNSPSPGVTLSADEEAEVQAAHTVPQLSSDSGDPWKSDAQLRPADSSVHEVPRRVGAEP
jgi:hypothetical protein